MNIDEFERTKPKETYSTINKIIEKWEKANKLCSIERTVVNHSNPINVIDKFLKDLYLIKEKFLDGG